MSTIDLGTAVVSITVEYDGRAIGTISAGENLAKIKGLVKSNAPGIKSMRATINDDARTELDSDDLELSLDEAINEFGDFTKVSITGTVSPSGALA